MKSVLFWCDVHILNDHILTADSSQKYSAEFYFTMTLTKFFSYSVW